MEAQPILQTFDGISGVVLWPKIVQKAVVLHGHIFMLAILSVAFLVEDVVRTTL